MSNLTKRNRVAIVYPNTFNYMLINIKDLIFYSHRVFSDNNCSIKNVQLIDIELPQQK